MAGVATRCRIEVTTNQRHTGRTKRDQEGRTISQGWEEETAPVE